jgi:hypothetical protein
VVGIKAFPRHGSGWKKHRRSEGASAWDGLASPSDYDPMNSRTEYSVVLQSWNVFTVAGTVLRTNNVSASKRSTPCRYQYLHTAPGTRCTWEIT